MIKLWQNILRNKNKSHKFIYEEDEEEEEKTVPNDY